MNLYETEALMFDPERGRDEPATADVFSFLFFLCSLPVWVDKCAWCLFYGESVFTQKENKQRGGNKTHHAARLVHLMLHAAEGGTSHKH